MSVPPLLQTHGARRDLGETIVAMAWAGDLCLVATADAAVRAYRADGDLAWTREGLHAGGLLCGAAGLSGLVTGGDDGKVMRIGVDGAADLLAEHKGGWVEAVAAQPRGALAAAAIGKDAALIKPGAGIVHRFDHPATVHDLAFEPNGRRLAAAYYNGVTLSWASNPDSRRKPLTWKGAHLKIGWSRDARFVVTAMQENALHGWRLQDGKDFQMAGYPAKIRALDFSSDGRWLVCAGAPTLTGWPFVGQNGPMGQNAAMLGEMPAPIAFVACSPARPIVAAADAHGEVALFSLAEEMRPVLVAVGEGAPVVAGAWSPDGGRFAFGDEAGRLSLLDFSSFTA